MERVVAWGVVISHLLNRGDDDKTEVGLFDGLEVVGVRVVVGVAVVVMAASSADRWRRCLVVRGPVGVILTRTEVVDSPNVVQLAAQDLEWNAIRHTATHCRVELARRGICTKGKQSGIN